MPRTRPARGASRLCARLPLSTAARSSRASGCATRRFRRLAAARQADAARSARSRSVLDRLAAALAAAGDQRTPSLAARRRLALDPLHEPAHRRLIRLLAEVGDRRRRSSSTATASACSTASSACARSTRRRRSTTPCSRARSGDHSAAGRRAAATEARRRSSVATRARCAARDLRARSGQTAGSRCSSARPESARRGSARAARPRHGDGEIAASPVATRRRPSSPTVSSAPAARRARRGGTAGRRRPWWVEEVARLAARARPPQARAVDSTAAQVRFYEAVCAFLLHRLGAGARGAPRRRRALGRRGVAAAPALPRTPARRTAARCSSSRWQPEAVPAEHPLRRLLRMRSATGRRACSRSAG